MQIITRQWTIVSKAVCTVPNSDGIWACVQALGCVAAFGTSAMMMTTSTTTTRTSTFTTDRFMKFDPEEDLPSIHHVVKTFARTLIVPSVPEELIWRVLLLQPPPIPSPSSYWSSPRVLFVNVLFAAYHYHGSVILTEIFHNKNDHDRSYAGAKTVFRDPMFLTLAFVLGNACSYAYQRSGYSLWAPVIVHAVSVTVWLTLLSGEKALSTPGGLSSSNSSSGMG